MFTFHALRVCALAIKFQSSSLFFEQSDGRDAHTKSIRLKFDQISLQLERYAIMFDL